MSKSNIILHYRSKHLPVLKNVQRLEQSNANKDQIRENVQDTHAKYRSTNKAASLKQLFKPTPHLESSSSAAAHSMSTAHETGIAISRPKPTPKQLQAFGMVLYSCATGTPTSQVASPLFQGLIDVFGGRQQFSSKNIIDTNMFDTYRAVCKMLHSSAKDAKTGCVTFDGWSAAHAKPVLGITWHFIDSSWNLKRIPIGTQHIGEASKNAFQLCAILEQVVQDNHIIGLNNIRIHTATSANEPATAVAMDMFTY